MFIDGEVAYDDALLYGYRSHRYKGRVSPLWRVISCPFYFQGTKPTKKQDSRPSPSYTQFRGV